MKITKFVHSCLLVEMPDRTALFDPGVYSTVDVDKLQYLDDIFITHIHADHLNIELVKKLAAKFPEVRIITTPEIVEQLQAEGVRASAQPPEGVTFFDSPHEFLAPLIPKPPQEIGVHYLDKLSHPGDSHSFKETKAILALPMQASWGSTTAAAKLAADLKPRYIIPIHDWHWNDEARESLYDRFVQIFKEQGITFIKPVNGEPFKIDV
ncbi:MAG TPA: MBL fold metallo-hydrolase [Candidatus Saccharimonadales bacterium]|nr:MBL fold metallo-hydrolase [Candidatus Saccharimonadales bacterium]